MVEREDSEYTSGYYDDAGEKQNYLEEWEREREKQRQGGYRSTKRAEEYKR